MGTVTPTSWLSFDDTNTAWTADTLLTATQQGDGAARYQGGEVRTTAATKVLTLTPPAKSVVQIRPVTISAGTGVVTVQRWPLRTPANTVPSNELTDLGNASVVLASTGDGWSDLAGDRKVTVTVATNNATIDVAITVESAED